MKKLFIICSIIYATSSFAQDGTGTSSTPPNINTWELSLGIGVEQYDQPYIDSASIIGPDRIVTLEKSYETNPSAWLTVNWNVFGLGKGDGTLRGIHQGNDADTVKFGFFAGVKVLGEDSETFGAFSLGPQVSFELDDRVISVGLGWVTHTNRSFANGITAGEALPMRYDDIVFEENSENSVMLMFSIGI